MPDFGANRYTVQWLKLDNQGLWYVEKENYLFMPLGIGEIMTEDVHIEKCKKCGEMPAFKTDFKKYPIEPYSIECKCGEYERGATASEVWERWNGRGNENPSSRKDTKY